MAKNCPWKANQPRSLHPDAERGQRWEPPNPSQAALHVGEGGRLSPFNPAELPQAEAPV